MFSLTFYMTIDVLVSPCSWCIALALLFHHTQVKSAALYSQQVLNMPPEDDTTVLNCVAYWSFNCIHLCCVGECSMWLKQEVGQSGTARNNYI